MDLRREPRFEVQDPVTITVLSGDESRHQGVVTNYSQRGMRLMLDAPVPTGAAVKIEMANALLLGEVMYCYPAGMQFAVGLEMHQAVYGLDELARLSERLLGELHRSAAGQPRIADQPRIAAAN